MQRLSSYRAVNTLPLGCKNQTVNAVQRKNACWILWTTYNTLVHPVDRKYNFRILGFVVYIATTILQGLKEYWIFSPNRTLQTL